MEKKVKRLNRSKLAFNFKSAQKILSGQEVIEEMKRFTDNNGVLYIPNHDDTSDDNLVYYRLEMDYSKADEKAFISDADNLVKNIYDIFTFCKKVKIDSEVFLSQENKAKSVLPQNLFETWNTYIRDLEVKGFDESLVKIMYGQEVYITDKHLSKEEIAIWHKYMAAKQVEAAKRIGDGVAAYTVIARAQRLLIILELGAPEIILNNETNDLIISLAIHRFAKTKTAVEKIV